MRKKQIRFISSLNVIILYTMIIDNILGFEDFLLFIKQMFWNFFFIRTQISSRIFCNPKSRSVKNIE